ncbi:MAG: hypothetical protein UE116_05510 [Clostridia bacterium]|nr:hypothetical protein [Clostridia bacterium]
MKKNNEKEKKQQSLGATHTHGSFTLNKKIIIVTSLVLIIVLTTTLAIGILSKKQKSTIVEAKKTNLNLQNNEHMHVELDSSGDKVPVPNGYVGSKVTGENEINTGYVIYEGEEEVNDTNKDETQKSRNQYVWIPVPDPSKFYGTDANGKKWGKLYEFTSGTSSDPLFDEVTGTYPLNWSESNGIMRINGKTQYREPDVVPYGSTVYDGDSRLKTLGLGARTTQEFLSQVESEFNRMLTSVEKYGGFYIGRYETGNLSKETAVVKKGNTDINYQTWYNMYKRCKNLKGKNTNVETGIAWGNQFDRTLAWLVETGNKTKQEITDDSTNWGNYYNATFEYINSSGNTATKNKDSSTRIPTGSAEYTKANNIYDLSGNVWDWTMKAYDTSIRIIRGGDFYGTGTVVPAVIRYGNGPTASSSYHGCRSALYIK